MQALMRLAAFTAVLQLAILQASSTGAQTPAQPTQSELMAQHIARFQELLDARKRLAAEPQSSDRDNKIKELDRALGREKIDLREAVWNERKRLIAEAMALRKDNKPDEAKRSLDHAQELDRWFQDDPGL